MTVVIRFQNDTNNKRIIILKKIVAPAQRNKKHQVFMRRIVNAHLLAQWQFGDLFKEGKKNFEKMLFAEKILEKLYFATFPVCFGCSFQNESFVFNNEKYFSLAFLFDSDYVNVCRRVIMYFAVIVTIVKFYLSKLVCM